MRSSNEKFSLALCGGGGKGAYQIGVWKALKELDMAKDLEAVSGTSVGALNAVLIALGDFENAQRIWKNIRPETLLSLSTSNEQGLFTREDCLKY
ncbi:patatin-like phospholipase family protein [Huintestinicola sp.]